MKQNDDTIQNFDRPDYVMKEKISALLQTEWAGNTLYCFKVTDSTNDAAARLAKKNAPHGTLIVADSQESGKGRRGRAWKTPPGTSIAMSLIVRPSLHPACASMMTLVMGMAAAASIREMCGVDAHIKWPNDVVADGKKICGILTEMSCRADAIDYVVTGIGINANVEDFPSELSEKAVSLRQLTGREIDRASLIALCMEKLEYYYGRFVETQDMSLLKDEYNQFLAGRNHTVRVMDPVNEYSGISLGINDRGELMVEKEDGTVRNVYAGEVSVRGIYGYV